jgi:hypothetical protein
MPYPEFNGIGSGSGEQMNGIGKFRIVGNTRSGVSEIPMNAVSRRPNIGFKMNGVTYTMAGIIDIGFVSLKKLAKTLIIPNIPCSFQVNRILNIIAGKTRVGGVIDHIEIMFPSPMIQIYFSIGSHLNLIAGAVPDMHAALYK